MATKKSSKEKEAPKVEEATEDLTNVKPEVVPLEQVKTILAKPLLEKLIAELIKKSQTLNIIDENDKEGYNAVHKVWQQARQLRLDIEKARKQYVGPAVVYQKEVNAYAKFLTGMVETPEKRAGDKLEFIDNIVEEKKKEKERLAEEAFNKRVSTVYAAGMTFNGINYVYEDIFISPVDLRAWEEGLITNFLVTVKERKEFREQEAKDAKDAADLIAKKNKQLEADNKKLVGEINAGKKAITDARLKKLMELGFSKNITGQHNTGGVTILQSQLESTEEDWEQIFNDAKERITKAAKDKEDQAAKELAEANERDIQAKKFRASQLLQDIESIEFSLTTLLTLNLLEGSNDLTRELFLDVRRNVDNAITKLQAAQKQAYFKEEVDGDTVTK